MKDIKFWFVLILIFTGNIVKAQPPTKQVIDEVIAVVGNTPILRSELDIIISQMDPDILVTEEIKCQLFKRLLTDKMLLHQAELDSLPVTDQEVDDKMDNNLRFFERQMNSRSELEKYLGMSIAEYKKQLRSRVKNQMLVERMEQKIQGNVKVTPKEVRAYFQKIPTDSLPFISSEVEVGQIVIKPIYSKEARELAKEQLGILRDRIMAGESFNRLAGLYSEDPGSKKTGGLLPEFGRNDMVPEFERTAFTMKKDSISEIIETKYGYHILRLIDKRGQRVIVRHILIRPRIIDTDMEIAKFKLDSIADLLNTKKISFCDAVKYYSEDEETKPNCGFFTDPNLGTQKIPYDYLDKEMSAEVNKLKPGQYSAPAIAFAPDGSEYYRLFYLKSESKPHTANLENDWQRIQSLALEDKRKSSLDIWAGEERKNVYFYISSNYIKCGFFDDWVTVKNN
ncbi:MAG: peptidylprolyl isomerase [Bacteroidetes bacterium]|nr:peptidylprolyl isomerase [Bacteroidota bacterium]